MAKESNKMARSASIAAAALLLGLAGCGGGARQVDYSQERGIDADISATRNTGPTGDDLGRLQRNEPYGTFPWNIDERHQSGR